MKHIYILLFPLLCLMTLSLAYAATAVPITVTMSEPVNVTGCPANCPRLTLDVGGVTRYADFSAGSGTANLTFTYTTQAGDVDLDGITISSNAIDLNTSGTVKDLNGNNLSPLTFTIPNTSSVKVNHPSLSMDFVGGDYILNDTHYATLPLFLSAATGTFTRASVGTYFDSSGTMQTATAGTPRFDHDPVTHAAKGILIEEARTNILTDSAQITSASSYGTSDASLVANVTTAPDGALTADKFNDTATNIRHILLPLRSSITTGTTYTGSVYVKAAEQQYIQLVFGTGSFGSTAYANFLLSGAGSVTHTAASITKTSITSVGNGWYRCSITGTSNATNVLEWTLFLALLNNTNDTNRTPAYAGTGTGVYVWGFQSEIGTFPTSYISTAATAVTRQADMLTIPSGAWFTNATSTIAGQYFAPAVNGISNHGVFSLNGGNLNNKTDLRSIGQSITSVGGVAQEIQFIAANGLSTNKFAKGISLNNIGYSINNSAVSLDNSASIPTVNQLQLGGLDASPSYNLCGYIYNIKYYPTRVADTQLQLLTQ